ncbi:hypothetical protein, partial [Methylobrevis pamukkalensis]|uniref:hypothetical protein n=1 Tax=Methylobrevis pamukkalensis TaxID=1439726 RepID=UPI00114CA31F
MGAVKHMRQVCFHIGAHKTASSLLQTLMNANRATFETADCEIVRRRDLVATPFFEDLHAHLESGVQEPSEAALSDIARLEHSSRARMIITNEDIVKFVRPPGFYDQAPEAIRFFRTCGLGGDYRVILYTREQSSYVESVYVQLIQLGSTMTFPEFWENWKRVNLSWSSVAERLVEFLGPDAVTVIPYESIRRLGTEGYFREFLRHCGIPDAGDLDTSSVSGTGGNF